MSMNWLMNEHQMMSSVDYEFWMRSVMSFCIKSIILVEVCCFPGCARSCACARARCAHATRTFYRVRLLFVARRALRLRVARACARAHRARVAHARALRAHVLRCACRARLRMRAGARLPRARFRAHVCARARAAGAHVVVVHVAHRVVRCRCSSTLLRWLYIALHAHVVAAHRAKKKNARARPALNGWRICVCVCVY